MQTYIQVKSPHNTLLNSTEHVHRLIQSHSEMPAPQIGLVLQERLVLCLNGHVHPRKLTDTEHSHQRDIVLLTAFKMEGGGGELQ